MLSIKRFRILQTSRFLVLYILARLLVILYQKKAMSGKKT